MQGSRNIYVCYKVKQRNLSYPEFSSIERKSAKRPKLPAILGVGISRAYWRVLKR